MHGVYILYFFQATRTTSETVFVMQGLHWLTLLKPGESAELVQAGLCLQA